MSEENSQIDFEVEYQSRYAWRAKRHIQNLAELSQLIPWSRKEDINFFAKMHMASRYDRLEPIDAFSQSIVTLWAEAQDCFVFGKFQACILTCGAVVERCLKYEYLKAKGSLPAERPTLGTMIKKLDGAGIVDSQAIVEAKRILDPRNSRAHALLEASDPETAYFGSQRGLYPVGGAQNIIEHYRGDAVEVIKSTAEVLRLIYRLA